MAIGVKVPREFLEEIENKMDEARIDYQIWDVEALILTEPECVDVECVNEKDEMTFLDIVGKIIGPDNKKDSQITTRV